MGDLEVHYFSSSEIVVIFDMMNFFRWWTFERVDRQDG